MFINAVEIEAKKAHCGERAANYFFKKGFSLFGINDDEKIFLFTEEFMAAYNKAPFWIKLGMVIK